MNVRAILTSLNCDGRRGLALGALCLGLVALTAGGEGTRQLLRYERAGLARGQWWRAVTAHLVHLDLRHALLNCGGLVLVWALFARDYSPRRWLLIVLAGRGRHRRGPVVRRFDRPVVRGFLGRAARSHGGRGAGAPAPRRARWLGARGAASPRSSLYEHLAGALPFSGSDPVVVDAHLYGALGGPAAAALLGARRQSL